MTGNFDKENGYEQLRQMWKDLDELALQAEQHGCGEAATVIDEAHRLLFKAMTMLKEAQ